MSYQVLARKWRPRHFQDMLGQETILRMLINALNHQRLHHAYLFTGTRGVGKATLARLFAKCVNCAKGISSTPCDACAIRTAIDLGHFMDLIEVDAASRTKVEDTRELLENVQYPPSQGRFKIYLIDEVHMLSGHSFNALLKTLEEPPTHVKFLLATTDPKRLPVTILSRCLQFHLKRVPAEKIAAHLAKISTDEKMTFEISALQLLAKAADGSVRDALSLLDQAIALTGDHITTHHVREMLGCTDQQNIIDLLSAIAKRDGKQLIDKINTLADDAPDYQQLLDDLLTLLHQLSMAQVFELTPLKQIAALFSPEDIQLYYQIALIGKRDLPLSPHPALGFEMVMLRMLAFTPVFETTTTPTTEPTCSSEQTDTISPPPPVSLIVPPTVHEVEHDWNTLLSKLKLTGLAQALAENCSLDSITDHNIKLTLSTHHQPMLSKKSMERIEESLQHYFNKPIKLTIHLSTTEVLAPAKQKHAEESQRQENTIASIKNDTQLKEIMNMFNATLDLNSVKLIDS